MYEGNQVFWAEVGDKNNAIKFTQVRSKEGSYFKVNGKNGYNFDVALGDYKADVQIAMYVAHKNGSQLFMVNKDKTISPTKAPNLVWGIGPNRELILVEAVDIQRRLLFKDLKPTQFNVVKSFKLALGSHKGKGIVMTGENVQKNNGLEQHLKIGLAKDALSMFIDADGYIHHSNQPYQVFDAQSHVQSKRSRDLVLFSMSS